MPLYELVAIASHYANYKPIRDLVRSTALHVMEHGGEVRSIKSWGTLPLPEKMRRHKVNHTYGDYYVMTFDCSPVTLKSLDVAYGKDPRVVRWTNIKLGESLGAVTQRSAHKTTDWGSNLLEPRYPHAALLNDQPLRRAAEAAFGAPGTSASVGAGRPVAEDDMFSAMDRSYGAEGAAGRRAAGTGPPVGAMGGPRSSNASSSSSSRPSAAGP